MGVYIYIYVYVHECMYVFISFFFFFWGVGGVGAWSVQRQRIFNFFLNRLRQELVASSMKHFLIVNNLLDTVTFKV